MVSRAWISEILAGDPLGPACPGEWRKWVHGRIYQALEAPRNLVVRSRSEQQAKPEDAWMMRMVHRHFSTKPVAFENSRPSSMFIQTLTWPPLKSRAQVGTVGETPSVNIALDLPRILFVCSSLSKPSATTRMAVAST